MRLRKLIFFRMAVLLTLMTITSSTVFVFLTTIHHQEETKAEWRTRALVLAEAVHRLVLWDDRVALRELLMSEEQQNGVLSYAFVSIAGKPYISTFERGVPLALQQRKIATHAPSVWEFEDSEGKEMYEVTSGLDMPGAFLHLGLSQSAINNQMRMLLAVVIVLGLLVIAVGLIFAHFMARAATREVDMLSEALRLYGESDEKGELTLLPETSEVADLVRSFKTIAAERFRAEEEIRKLNAELEDRVRVRTEQLANAYRELDSFSYSVSHDLRAPLRGIDGFSLALLEDYGDRLDSQAKGYLERIRNGCVRMGELINDLLQLSRITRREIVRKPVDLSEMVMEIAEELRLREPGRMVEFVVTPGAVIDADPVLMRSVLDNLVGNAWKFTVKCPQPRIVFDYRKDGEMICCWVKDNGAGFDMEYADKLFCAFQRLHSTEEFEGIGIGLATVQRVINRHGGRVWGEGCTGKGAAFYFTLGGRQS